MKPAQQQVMLAVVTVIGGLFLYACCCQTVAPMAHPECPHNWTFGKISFLDSTGQRVYLKTLSSSGTLSASEVQTDVPEFNDCQRLIVRNGNERKYDSLFAVFARDSLDDTLTITRGMVGGSAMPLAEVVALGDSYPPLGIKPGFNCVFVWMEGSEWRAAMRPYGENEGECRQPQSLSNVFEGEAGRTLAIVRSTSPSLSLNDYPNVARWDWDVRREQQVIGFKCLDGWCEVGEMGATPLTLPPLAERSDLPEQLRPLATTPVLRVKGWYDEQDLSPAHLHWWEHGEGPTDILGTIIPVPQLGTFSAAVDFDAPSWKPIEYVLLSKPSNEYSEKRGYAPAGSDGSVTTISLCVEYWTTDVHPTGSKACPGIPEALHKTPTCGAEGYPSSGPTPSDPWKYWWVKTQPPAGEPAKYSCIVRRGMGGAPVPGTARWRWLADDETSWGRCGGGCCTTQ
jgi:hypothetical protein